MTQRSYLFLQGVCSPFFAQLADRLHADGYSVFKLNFNGGDDAYWWPRPAWRFRGPAAEVAEFLDAQYRQFGITDQILFGDRRPLHRPAVARAERHGIRTHVFEEGYFRPHWVTLEREGVNGHSLLPRDPDWFHAVGAGLPEPTVQRFRAPFWQRAAHDVAYNVARLTDPLRYPRYASHAPVNPAVEYAGYVQRFIRLQGRQAADADCIRRVSSSRQPLYVLPLQLNSDAQIRDHSRFANMTEVLAFVLESFARHAPANARLVVKNHPLDIGWTHYPSILHRLCAEFGLNGRVDYLETGDLAALLQHARGMVTVNSTAGGLALGLGCAVIALSDPIYNLPGLCFQGSLDAFWRDAVKPDAELFRRFRTVVIHATQPNGGFYSPEGIGLAVANSLPLLTADRSPVQAWL